MQLRGRHVDVDDGDVGGGIGAQHLGRRALAVLEVDGHRGRVGHDVLIGEDVAV
jgi:hypothetical protein